MPSATDRPADHQPYVFVSYASADRERVLPLVDMLMRAGVPVWIDREGIHGGANYARAIAEAIKGAAAFVLMASALSLASRNVKQEIAVAWEYERAYLPLLLERVTIPDDVKYWLTAAQWIEVLDKAEDAWLPAVLTALAPLGIAPSVAAREEMHLAGRERELALLRDKLAAAKGGTGGLALIGGEAGIGKTTLAEAVLHEAAQRGCVVLEGHCFDLAETPPYGPWIDLFAHYVPSPSAPPLPEPFARRGTVGVVSSQMALFVAVEDFLSALAARQSVVLLLDDLHWSDPASLDLLRFLARSVATLPLLLLVTYRSDELTRRHPLSALLPQLAREASADRLDLARLDDDAVRQIAAARYALPEEETRRLVAYLQVRAAGNALFVGELLRALEEADALRQEDGDWLLGVLGATAVPALLRQVIDGRLSRFDDESRRLLAVAAVIGQDVPLAVWAAAGEADEDGLLDLTEHAEEANLLAGTPDGTGVRFAHALIREALYEGIPSVRRRRLHRRAGEALAETRNPDPDAVAMHFQQAADGRAVTWLVKAGERAQLSFARLTAAERYEAALTLLEAGDGDLGERGWLRYRVALVRRYSVPQQSIEYLNEALGIAAAIGDRTLAAAARYCRGLCLVYLEDADCIAEMTAGCDALEALSPEELARMDLGPDEQGLPTVTNARGFLVGVLAGHAGRIAEAITMGEAARDGKPRNTPLASVAWHNYGDRDAGLGTAYALAGRPADAVAAAERARACYREVGNYSTGNTFVIELLGVWLPYYTDQPHDLARVAAMSEAAYRGAERTNYERLAYLPLLALAGRWAEAEEGAEDALRRPWGQRAFRWIATLVLSDITRAQGEWGVAETLIREALPSGPQTPPGARFWFIWLPLMQMAARLSLDTSELATAREWLEAHDRWLAWSGAVLGQSEGQALWSQYHRQAGDRDQAYEHAERALAHATEPRQPLALIAAHRLLGELDTEAGRYEDAGHHLDASLALADACQAPYERALTLLAMAALRAAQGASDEAQRLLDAVKAICEPLGAKPALARADVVAARLTSG